jgi:hypothetical protein
VRAAAFGLALLSLAGLGLASAGGRARHLALPVLSDPSLPAAPPSPLADPPRCMVEELGRVPARPTALLRAGDGAIWVGTFDRSVWRITGEAAQEVPGLEGRERFVNALAESDGLVWAGTQRGAVAFEGGRRAFTALAGAGVTAFAHAGGALVAGTSRGLAVLSRRGARWVKLEGAAAEPRVTALAAGAEVLWAGTSDGVLAVPLTAALSGRAAARWIPLVFGEPPARTNVVVALAPLGAGAVAGTDDGGLVLVAPDGRASALLFDVARANEANPGAAAALPGAAALGTQGAGLLLARERGGRLTAARAAGFPSASASAVARDGDALLAGTEEGAVLRVRCDD